MARIECFLSEKTDWDSSMVPGTMFWNGAHLYVVVPSDTPVRIQGPPETPSIWTTTGTPPKVTCSPSIRVSHVNEELWHGYLEDGWLRGVAPWDGD